MNHLGSIQCLTNDAGALAEEMSYDAWGNRRDPDTWQLYTAPQTGLITDRGFTGHEHIDLFDLVNMDGRVYDPTIGRFLSADPVIQDPENLQSLNRYSYCLNNPLSLTDPSGYSWLSENWRGLLGAAIGISASIVTAGLLAPAGLATLTIWGATAAGAVGGFAGGFAGTLLDGGNLGQAFKAGVVGGLIGGASGFLSYAAGAINGNSLSAILERMGRHAFVNAWLAGIQGQNMWSAALTGGASSLGGAGLTALNTENVGLLCAANAVIGGTVSVIGGGKFANGAVTGAFTMLFNDLTHHMLFENRERAYKYMIKQAIANKHEVAAVELKDGSILVFKEQGNKYGQSINYFINKDGKTFVNINGKLVEAINQIHTHPGYYSSDIGNPLNVSDNDINIATRFNNEIRILMIQSKTLFSVSTNGNGLMYPQELWQGK